MPRSDLDPQDLSRRRARGDGHRLPARPCDRARVRAETQPTDAAVRTTLRILVRKGPAEAAVLTGRSFVYFPTLARGQRWSAFRHLLETFFGGSSARRVAALVEMEDAGCRRASAAASRR